MMTIIRLDLIGGGLAAVNTADITRVVSDGEGCQVHLKNPTQVLHAHTSAAKFVADAWQSVYEVKVSYSDLNLTSIGAELREALRRCPPADRRTQAI